MKNIITNANTPWKCLRHPIKNIFYWVHSKCANTYYRKIFQQLNWVDATLHDIDWENSQVVSHIRHPLSKHRTGLIEYFFYHDCVEILKRNYNDNNFWLMLSRSAWLDIHSMSIWEHLGDRINDIHWIPIDVKHRDHLSETLDFIDFNDDREKFRRLPNLNVSTGFKKSCVERLSALDPDVMIIKYLERDTIIYDKVTKEPGFEPEDYKKNIEKLLQQGISQLDAEKILDQEVQDGTYLHWSKE